MFLFHKSVNKRLAEHVAELNKFGLIPDNWHWHRDKILELEKIDEKLIDDLNQLHDENRGSEEAASKLIPLLKGLHDDLKNILGQGILSPDAQKCEADAINKMISSIMVFLLRTAKQGTPEGTFYGPRYVLDKRRSDRGYHCHILNARNKMKKINWIITIKGNSFYALKHGKSEDFLKVDFKKEMPEILGDIEYDIYNAFKPLINSRNTYYREIPDDKENYELGSIDYFKEKARN
jgi:hypothetical protein